MYISRRKHRNQNKAVYTDNGMRNTAETVSASDAIPVCEKDYLGDNNQNSELSGNGAQNGAQSGAQSGTQGGVQGGGGVNKGMPDVSPSVPEQTENTDNMDNMDNADNMPNTGDNNGAGQNMGEENEAVPESGGMNIREFIMSESNTDRGEGSGERLEVEREFLTPQITPRTAEQNDGGMTEENGQGGESDMSQTEDNNTNEQNNGNAQSDLFVPINPQVLDPTDGDDSNMTYEEFLRANTSTGLLRIQASAGNRSIPLVNVNIEVYKDFADGRHVFHSVVTNADGVADNLELPAPPRENSIVGNGQKPFSSYVVSANREGMRGETVEYVPIFAGVKSIQPITLTNLPGEV